MVSLSAYQAATTVDCCSGGRDYEDARGSSGLRDHNLNPASNRLKGDHCQ